MYEILQVMTKLMAPILSFTSEEVWTYMRHKDTDNNMSILFESFPVENIEYNDEKLIEKWDRIFKVKEDLAKNIEEARASKLIGSSLDARIEIHTSGDDFKFVTENKEAIQLVLIVSELEIFESEEYKVVVDKAYGDKCARCWTYSPYVGRDLKHEYLCKKCIDNIAE
jgi:isoleucyl-tRNA synthetase